MVKRIAYLVSQYPAPSHTFIRREVLALRSLGFHVETYSIRHPDQNSRLSEEDAKEAKNTFYVLPASPAVISKAHLASVLIHPLRYIGAFCESLKHRPPGLRSFIKSLFYFAEAIIVARSISTAQLTHLHNHFANPGAIVGYLASKFLNIDYSLTLHGISEFEYPAGLLLSKKVEHAKFVPCVSYFTRAQACLHTHPDQWHKFTVIRSGIDLNKIIPAQNNDDENNIKLLSVGRLSHEKGQLALLKVFRSLSDQFPGLSLDIVGEGPERRRLEEFLEKSKLGHRCKLLGQQPEDVVLKRISEADVFVMTSFMEGLPIVLMEAMAAGVTVIAPCVAGIPEIVDHDDSGLLYPPTDWNRLSELLETLIKDKSLRNRLSSQAKHRICPEYDIRSSITPLAGLFDSHS